MATTSNTITATAGQTEFSFSFPYLKKESIKVTIDTVATAAFTIPDNNPTTVILNSGATAGQVIKISRLTSTTATPSTFFSGGAIRSQDLNNNFDSILYITQERENQTEEIIQGGIADGSITSSKLADQSVGTAALIDGGVATVDLADNAVTTPKIINDAVTTPKIIDDAVTTAKIIDDAVTTAKITDNAVTTAKIEDDAVTAQKLDPAIIFVPTGAIITFGGSTAPAGYLECNGQTTSGYAALAAVVGATVPDLRGEFVRGWDNGKGTDSGRSILSAQAENYKAHNHSSTAVSNHTHTINSAGNHTHTINGVGNHQHGGAPSANSSNFTSGINSGGGGGNTSNAGAHSHTMNAAGTHNHSMGGAGSHNHTIGNSGGSETRPRNIALMYIIKT